MSLTGGKNFGFEIEYFLSFYKYTSMELESQNWPVPRLTQIESTQVQLYPYFKSRQEKLDLHRAF